MTSECFLAFFKHLHFLFFFFLPFGNPCHLSIMNLIPRALNSAKICFQRIPTRSFTTQFALLQNQQKQTISSKLPDLQPLKFEKDLYATIRIHNRPYLITEGDKIILPFRLKNAEVGDVLNFDDVTTIGSRNFTYSDTPIDSSLYSIKATVIEKTKKPMYTKEITKRRQRHVRHVNVKHDLTVLRVSELKLS